jgi:hypothetical protein
VAVACDTTGWISGQTLKRIAIVDVVQFSQSVLRGTNVNTKTKFGVPILKIRKGATKKEIYAAAKKAFTAADLQKYTEIEPMVPASKVLAEMKRLHQSITAKKTKKRK